MKFYILYFFLRSIQGMKVCSECLCFQSQTRILKFPFLSEKSICVYCFFFLLNNNDEERKKRFFVAIINFVGTSEKNETSNERLRSARQILNDSSSLVIDRKIVAKSLTFQINGCHKMHL